MKLIDVDKLIDDFKNELEKVDFEKLSDNDKLVISTSAIALKDFVKRQPIAYNIDKVVEELEFELGQYDKGLTEMAIEIAKRGGVDDD